MILAAGKGTRLQPLTLTTPKPLLKLDKHSIIEHLIQNLVANGFSDIVINISYLQEQIVQTLGDGTRYGANIIYSIEDRALETGGGICNALPLLGMSPFLVVSADIYTQYPFKNCRKHQPEWAHLVMVNNPTWHINGDFKLNGNLLGMSQGIPLTYANICILNPRAFTNITPHYFRLADIFKTGMQNPSHIVTGEHYLGNWHNIGTLSNLNHVKSTYFTKDMPA